MFSSNTEARTFLAEDISKDIELIPILKEKTKKEKFCLELLPRFTFLRTLWMVISIKLVSS